MPTPEEMKELAREFNHRVFEERNLDYVENTLSDDFVEQSPLSPDMPPDKKGGLETFRTILANSSDIRGEILDLVASGNKLAIRTRFSGTDDGAGWGALMGAPATGKSFTVESIDVLTVNDQKQFTEHYGIFDVPGMMMQLGLMPAPGGSEG